MVLAILVNIWKSMRHTTWHDVTCEITAVATIRVRSALVEIAIILGVIASIIKRHTTLTRLT